MGKDSYSFVSLCVSLHVSYEGQPEGPGGTGVPLVLKKTGIKNRDITSDELEERTLEVACKSLALKNTDTVVKYTT